MQPALICLAAILLDRFFNLPPRLDPGAHLDGLSERVAQHCLGAAGPEPPLQRLLGLGAVLLLVIPPSLFVWGLSAIPYLGVAVELGLLYLALDAARLLQQAAAVQSALRDGDLSAAWDQLETLSDPDIQVLNEEAISLATVEAVLEKGCDSALGVLFWFLAAGAPGIIVYRLISLLRNHWDRRTPPYLYFGWAAARLHELLNWLPVRITALSYAALGKFTTAWRCWRSQAWSWRASSNRTLLAAGAGALRLQLGGDRRCNSCVILRPALGDGLMPRTSDIDRALNLVSRALGLWASLVLMAGLLLTLRQSGII